MKANSSRKTFNSLSVAAMTVAAFAALVLATAPARAAITGSGTPADPYVIASTDDWATFANTNNAAVYWASGVHARLDADVYASKSIGHENGYYRGVFDGNGHTVTMHEAEDPPFASLNGATVRNLRVAGDIIRNGNHGAGIAVSLHNDCGPSLIENCAVTALVDVTGEYGGGFVGHGGGEDAASANSLTIRGCVFAGAIWTDGTRHAGTFWGWSGSLSSVTLEDCLDATDLTDPIGLGLGTIAVSNVFYLAANKTAGPDRPWPADKRGSFVRSVTLGAGVAPAGAAREYDAAHLAFFGDLLRYEGGYWCAAGRTFEIGFAEDVGYVRAFRVEDADGNDITATALSGTTVTMPDGDVTISIVQSDAIDPAHFSQAGDVCTIQSSAGWEVFCDLLNGGAEDFAGKTVRLGADIAVARTAGTADHPFRGTFDGCGHTMDLAITDDENQGTAPFRYVADATIRYLRTTGRVTGGMHCAGLVGFATGAANLVHNCDVRTTVRCSGEYRSHAGGILGHGLASATTLRDCRFAGTIYGVSTATGVLYGWGDAPGPHAIRNCLDAATLELCYGVDLLKADGGSQIVENCYKFAARGSLGTQTDARGETLRDLLGANWTVDGNGDVVPILAPLAVPCTITVTKFHQSFPYTGKATVEYTVDGTLPADAVAEIEISADGASATFRQNGVVAGANAFTIDFASSFGGALLLTNASFTVTIVANFGGVQLWENGPFWAECNVGATKSEDYGYYFWWGDTVGYTNTGSGWISVKDGTSILFSDSGTAASTYGKDNSALLSEGWIDATGNLVAVHDAATAHLGAPWRMPTKEECAALADNGYCTASYAVSNGVPGKIVKGKGEYANRSIFIPFAGVGVDTRFDDGYDQGDRYSYYWSSTPEGNVRFWSWGFVFTLNYLDKYSLDRDAGLPVRPVRGFVEDVRAVGIVTYDPVVVVIESVGDWNEFCAAVADGSLATDGASVRLANDIGPVSTMVGTAEHPFAGVFYGGSNTLTLALSGTGDYVAPFSRVSGATIRDLKVSGTVSGGMHCSGLVGSADGATNRIEGCEVAAAISSSGTHFGGLVGHGKTSATTLLGCVFSGSFPSLTAAAYVGTLWGWSDDGAKATLIDCLDASEFHKPIGLGADPVCISNTYYLTYRVNPPDHVWSDGKRGKLARSVTAAEGVELGCGEPLRTYGASGLAAYPVGVAYGGTFYAASGESVTLSPVFTGTPPAGKVLDSFAASAGDFAKSGDAWVLTMPAEDVIISATFAEINAYGIWAAANGVSSAWDETDALGIHNVFRYLFDVPTGAFENPPLLDIVIEDGNAVVKTPPFANKDGFTVSVVESSDVAGATVTRRQTPDAEGRAVFAMVGAASRFYRLSATEGDENLGGVQLWEGGPYWAECNVGATTPEDYGCYFWWGDTVGYKHENDKWVATDGSSSDFQFDSENTPTYGKDDATLLSECTINATGNLVAAHDATTAHLGSPWRMPTDAEFSALLSNCTTTWITTNGVSGRLVTGKGAYADRSIFLPAAGSGYDSSLGSLGSEGSYWSSTPISDIPERAWSLNFASGGIYMHFYDRSVGRPVRPVRDAD